MPRVTVTVQKDESGLRDLRDGVAHAPEDECDAMSPQRRSERPRRSRGGLVSDPPAPALAFPRIAVAVPRHSADSWPREMKAVRTFVRGRELGEEFRARVDRDLRFVIEGDAQPGFRNINVW